MGSFPGRTRLFGFAIGTVTTAFVAVIPLAVALGGALTALVGSLGAASLGLGALGVSLGATAAVGFGGLALVVGQFLQDFKKVQTALQAYQIAVDQYGRGSQQAATAQGHLNAVVREFGGPRILEAVMAWQGLVKDFRRAVAPSINVLADAFLGLIDAAKKVMPVFAEVTNAVTGKLVKALGAVAPGLFSQLVGALRILGGVAGDLVNPLVSTLANLLSGLLTIATRTSPALGGLVGFVARLGAAFRTWAENVNIGGLVSQFNTWLGLLSAVSRLLITVLSAGAGQGQGLVKWLTIIVTKWNEWLNTPHGQKELASFFHDAIALTKVFASNLASVIKWVFLFGRAFMPIYTKVFVFLRDRWNRFMDALKPAEPFWTNVLKPLLSGLIKGVGSSLKAAFDVGIFIVGVLAKALGWLGKVLAPLSGVFKFVGYVIGFLFGGPILRALSSIGKLNILLRPLGMLFGLAAKPIEFVGAAIGRLVGWAGKLIGFFGRLAGSLVPGVSTAFNAVLSFITGLGPRFYSAGKNLWARMRQGIMEAIGTGLAFAGNIAKSVGNALIGLLNTAIPNKIPIPHFPDINLPDNPIPKLAGGGIVSGSGMWITGEAGPELNTLRGGRVTVQPLPAISAPGPGVATLDPGRRRETNITKIYLRGRQIAEAVSDEAEDQRARGG